MAKSKPNPNVDFFFNKARTWQQEYEELRTIVLESGLEEELKWGKPCYTLNGKNVLLIHGFKEYCAILFHKGALLKDEKGLLIRQTENVQAARQLRFTGIAEIKKLRSTIKAYIKEAAQNEKEGKEVKLKKTSEFTMPEEFRDKLEELPALERAFKALTPGRQRGYLLYFSQAKQSATRIARIEKYMEHIMKGKGLDD